MTCPDEKLKDLVERAKRYDTEAFGELYDLYFDKIYNYVFYKVGDTIEAEDLTEQVFLKALESIRSFAWRGAPFSAWLFRIAGNLVVDYYRKRSRMTTVPIDSSFKDILTSAGTEDVEEVVMKKFSWEKLYLAISKLTEEQQQVVILKFLTNLSNTEIANFLKKTEGAVKSLQHRALNSLHRILKGESEDEL